MIRGVRLRALRARHGAPVPQTILLVAGSGVGVTPVFALAILKSRSKSAGLRIASQSTMTIGAVVSTRVALVGVGAAILAFGVTKLASQLLLATWAAESAGSQDIAARGVWILAMFLPLIGLLAAAMASAATLLMIRSPRINRRNQCLHAAAAIAGSAVGAALIVLGLDPLVLLLRRVEDQHTYFWMSVAAAGLLITMALIWLRSQTIRQW